VSERARNMIAVGVIAASLAIVVGALAASNGGSGDRVERIAQQLKCPVCDTESVADSPAQVARDWLLLIEERVAAGWSDDEIIDDFVATYGEQARLDPPNDARTALLWALPVVALGIGAVLIVGRRSPQRGRELTAEEMRRVEDEVARRDQ
jgi:cytochrome c-type biogenesis protein CcmH